PAATALAAFSTAAFAPCASPARHTRAPAGAYTAKRRPTAAAPAASFAPAFAAPAASATPAASRWDAARPTGGERSDKRAASADGGLKGIGIRNIQILVEHGVGDGVPNGMCHFLGGATLHRSGFGRFISRAFRRNDFDLLGRGLGGLSCRLSDRLS